MELGFTKKQTTQLVQRNDRLVHGWQAFHDL
jgi:hypothetical protein